MRLIFATRVKLSEQEMDKILATQGEIDPKEMDMGTSIQSGYKMRVSLKPDWVYHLHQPPAHTISYTLRKFGICSDPRLELKMAEMY